jgi:SAM-dependent methyltransferase
LKFGTDTGGYLSPDQLRSDPGHDSTSNGYSAVAPSVFREACRRWRETLPPSAARLDAYTFVDIGAGKGRALLLATELQFRRVIGVELNKGLADTARRNVTLWSRFARPCTKIRVLQEDASEFGWPRTPMLVYLNNPFECELVEQMAKKIAVAAESGHGLVDVLYVNPGCAETLIRLGNFRLLWNAQIEMDPADKRADPYGASADRVAAFRFCRAGNGEHSRSASLPTGARRPRQIARAPVA